MSQTPNVPLEPPAVLRVVARVEPRSADVPRAVVVRVAPHPDAVPRCVVVHVQPAPPGPR
jgi:hypothetical protein